MVVLGGALEEKSGIGFGCMSVSGQYSDGVPMDEQASFDLFKGVYDAGCRHFDTAEIYTSGAFDALPTEDTVFNESQLGRFLTTVPRDSFTVATKYMTLAHGNTSKYESVREALLASLSRLGLEYVDVYYSHRVLSCEDGIEFVGSVKRFISEGLVRNVGLSEVSAEWLRQAHAIHPVCCVQQEWSLLTRNLEESLAPTCRELGVGIVAYSPLARNLLTLPEERPVDLRRQTVPRFSAENFEQNKQMLKDVQDLAAKHGVSPAQLSIAWLRRKAEDLGVGCVPIPGTTKLAHAQDNIASARISLTEPDMALLEGVAARTAGARESDQYLSITMEQGAKL